VQQLEAVAARGPFVVLEIGEPLRVDARRLQTADVAGASRNLSSLA
jgi:hypothetical protein